MKRLIFHVDVNSAFLSWEAARQVSEGKPDLRLIPSAVGGDRTKRTGVILAKSIPAKRFGIQTGEPVGAALRKCPELTLVPPDFKLYHQCSQAFVQICRRYAPVVEQVSIDECYLDMSGTGRIYPDPEKIAREIKDTIRTNLGFTVNVGIGSNKLLAKMASDFEKPDKVHTLYDHQIQDKLWPLGVGSLFTVGQSSAQKLCKAGILTVGQLAACDTGMLQRMFGPKMAEHLHRYANGIDDSPVLAEPEEAKGYSISTTLEDNITDADSACRILLALSDSVTSRMRSEGAKAGCIGVTIRSSDFKNKSHQRTLYESTDLFKEVYEISCALFHELWDGHTPLRLIGISLTQLSRGDSGQISLFEDTSREKLRRLDKAYDAIQAKYGHSAISRATSLQQSHPVGKKYQAQMELQNSKHEKNRK